MSSCFSRPAENRISFKSELRNLRTALPNDPPPVIISTLSLKLLEFNSIKYKSVYYCFKIVYFNASEAILSPIAKDEVAAGEGITNINDVLFSKNQKII
jgi:hypothetical protein